MAEEIQDKAEPGSENKALDYVAKGVEASL